MLLEGLTSSQNVQICQKVHHCGTSTKHDVKRCECTKVLCRREFHKNQSQKGMKFIIIWQDAQDSGFRIVKTSQERKLRTSRQLRINVVNPTAQQCSNMILDICL